LVPEKRKKKGGGVRRNFDGQHEKRVKGSPPLPRPQKGRPSPRAKGVPAASERRVVLRWPGGGGISDKPKKKGTLGR